MVVWADVARRCESIRRPPSFFAGTMPAARRFRVIASGAFCGAVGATDAIPFAIRTGRGPLGSRHVYLISIWRAARSIARVRAADAAGENRDTGDSASFSQPRTIHLFDRESASAGRDPAQVRPGRRIVGLDGDLRGPAPVRRASSGARAVGVSGSILWGWSCRRELFGGVMRKDQGVEYVTSAAACGQWRRTGERPADARFFLGARGGRGRGSIWSARLRGAMASTWRLGSSGCFPRAASSAGHYIDVRRRASDRQFCAAVSRNCRTGLRA